MEAGRWKAREAGQNREVREGRAFRHPRRQAGTIQPTQPVIAQHYRELTSSDSSMSASSSSVLTSGEPASTGAGVASGSGSGSG
jgi:hypothetical protein